MTTMHIHMAEKNTVDMITVDAIKNNMTTIVPNHE
jgi:hypothetical protein